MSRPRLRLRMTTSRSDVRLGISYRERKVENTVMRLLLCKNVAELGIVGDIVDVSAGYARNYLLPQRLAAEPTEGNIRAVAEARRHAEHERARARAELESLAQRLEGTEVTVRARANEEGILYGSVGRREIVTALGEEGYYMKPDQVDLSTPIRHLDNVAVDIRLAPDLLSSIKVWVVRERTEEEESEVPDETRASREAGPDGDGTK